MKISVPCVPMMTPTHVCTPATTDKPVTKPKTQFAPHNQDKQILTKGNKQQPPIIPKDISNKNKEDRGRVKGKSLSRSQIVSFTIYNTALCLNFKICSMLD